MRRIDNKRIYKYMLFSVCFWVIIGPLLYRSFSGGWTTLGTSDAITQIYPVMLYVSRFLKNLVKAFFSKETFILPMVDYTIGMGEDIIATLNYYGFGDPFYLFTVLVPEQYMPYFYGFLFYFRVYLGGMAFIAFTYEVDDTKSNKAYVMGALVYCFTGFTLQSNMFTIFTHAMLYIPLMLLGVERTFARKKKGVLTCTVFLFALSGYFFLWVGSITIAVYIIYRVILRKTKALDVIRTLIELFVEYILGLGLAAAIFIPAASGFLHSIRSDFVFGLWAFKPMSFAKIITLLFNSFLPSFQEGQELAVCTIGLIFIIWTLLKKRNCKEKLTVILVILSAVFPAVSCIMSGFGGVYSRWELVIDLYIAFLVFKLWDEFRNIDLISKIGISVLYLGLLLIGKYYDILSHENFKVTLVNYSIILIIIWCAFPICKRNNTIQIYDYIVFGVIVYTVGSCWWATARDMPASNVQERNVISEFNCEKDFYRIDYEKGFMEPRLGMNVSFILQYPGISEYFSIENMRYITTPEKWGISTTNHNNAGIDQRTIIETISSVRYFISRPESETIVPYGFAKIKATDDEEWNLYENQHVLPLFYTYESIFDENKYVEMNGIERQDVMLQSASIENYDGFIPKANSVKGHVSYDTPEIKEIVNGAEKEGIVQSTTNTQIKLLVNLKSDGENYLYIDGKDGRYISSVEIENGYTKYFRGTDSQVVNLGWVNEDTQKTIIVTLHNNCQFNLSSIQSAFYDLSDYEKCVLDRGSDISSENIIVSVNKVECDVTLEGDRIICIALPYAEGWSAYIDNDKAKIYPINDMFMAIEVPQGAHHIELHYVTPGILAGLCVSLICAIVIIGYIIFNKMKNHN